MSSNEQLALSYLEDAKYSLEEALRAYNRGYYHRAVRRAQECIELCLKALLRLYGLEYPKTHDVSSILLLHKDRFPKWFARHIPLIAKISTELVQQRAPSFYGDEIRKIPAKQLFKEEDAIRAIENAKRVLKLIEELVKKWLEKSKKFKP